jgi:hypothetical protein
MVVLQDKFVRPYRVPMQENSQMKTTFVSTLLGMAAAGAVIVAPGALGDTDTAAYLGSLDKNGVHYPNAETAVKIGVAVCSDLRKGEGVAAELKDLVSGSNGAISLHDAGIIVGASAAALCPDENARVQAEAAALSGGA